jgi:hypothetical protein
MTQNPPIKVAFVIDGEVVDVLHTDERLAAIFLSNPTVVDVTSIYNQSPNPDINMTGWSYDGNSFSYPATPVFGQFETSVIEQADKELEEQDKQLSSEQE